MFLEISQSSLKNTCARVSFLIKLQVSGSGASVFAMNFVKFSKNTIFTEHLWTTASRAWKEIAKELDLENGKVVEQLWNNF